ncbi:MAG: hypothetical protein WCE58_03990 [Gallionella sp.]
MYTLNAHNNPSGNLENPKFLTIIVDLENLGLAEQFEMGIKIIDKIEVFAEEHTKGFLSYADIILGQLHLVLYCKQPDLAQKELLSMFENGEIKLTNSDDDAPFYQYTYSGESDPYGLLFEFLDAKGF